VGVVTTGWADLSWERGDKRSGKRVYDRSPHTDPMVDDTITTITAITMTFR
jgi:hypothetical protein